MRVILSRVAYERFAELLQSSHVGCEWICLEQDGTLTKAIDRELAATYDATVAWASTDVLYGSAPFFRMVTEMDSLKWLQSSFAGLDLPVYPSLLRRGVVVTTSHANSISIAEYVVGAVLRVYQQPDRWQRAQELREWRHHEFAEIYGSTWLVLGLGAIGTEVARRASAFGAKVLGVRRTPDGSEPVDRVLRPSELMDALPEADVIVLALPAQRETRHLVDSEFLGRLREGCLLVNVARGSLVSEADLLRSLDEGRPGIAVLDVFESEPLSPDSRLWADRRVVVTPHASSAGLGRHLRNAQLFIRNLQAWAGGRPLENVLTEQQVEAAQGGDDAPAQFKQ